MLQIKQLSKRFNDQLVLNNINMHIPKGAIIGLTGTSGSGKSTLLRCIQNLESYEQGTIELEGTCGFIFQDFQLFPHLRVLENLSYAPRLHKKIEVAQKALQLLTTLGLQEKQNAYPHQLSGGQKQRVALARSLMMEPDLLLCDEPTSGLDIQSTQQVIKLLTTVASMGVSLLISSHDISFLNQITESVVLLHKGKVVRNFKTKDNHLSTDIEKFYSEVR